MQSTKEQQGTLFDERTKKRKQKESILRHAQKAWGKRFIWAILWIFALILFFVIVEFKFVLFVDYLKTSNLWLWKVYGIIVTVYLLSRFVIANLYVDEHDKVHDDAQYPSVSVVIAAKNEENNIFRTISTVMDSQYPGFLECVVVNDGSTDGTGPEIQKAAVANSSKGGVSIVTFPVNKGKREAMAAGVKKSRGEIVVFVDSDSFVSPSGIKTIVEHFIEDPAVGAVTGNTGVENLHENLLTKIQSARYGVSYEIFKVCESVFGAVTCCSGCFSAYRRSAIEGVIPKWLTHTFFGTKGTFGDDRSLTNYVLRHAKVIYCRSAHATTVVPNNLMQFLRQQLRWKKSWIREGIAASKFMWRKNPIASIAFYINVLLPMIGPAAVFFGLLIPLFAFHIPIVYLLGVVAMALVFGIFYRLKTDRAVWWQVAIFSLMHVFVLVWQMPYAFIRLTDTRWGTR